MKFGQWQSYSRKFWEDNITQSTSSKFQIHNINVLAESLHAYDGNPY